MTELESAAGSIKRLPKEVVDRIAAGEVVQRPSAAVKELLENSLDAKSTHIVIHAENGGLSKLMITDNGCGIGQTDLEMAATRFCTSKLCTEQDFATLQTFGFRGEALASMSMVSRLSITSRVATSISGFQQQYLNGNALLKDPKPCARTVGTTVTCQELFYNLPQRKKLRESDEYKRILQVAEQYAVQYAGRGVAIVCQRSKNKNNSVVDLNTTNFIPKGNAVEKLTEEARNEVTKKVIAQVFDAKLDNRLLYLECFHTATAASVAAATAAAAAAAVVADDDDKIPESAATDPLTFHGKGFISHPSYESSSQSGTFVLFVNDRLVECPPLKRALETAYTGSTKSKPFLCFSLNVPPTQVDVNVHPTKKQVTLLHLDDICNAIHEAAKNLLSKHQDHTFSRSSVETIPTINPYVKRKRSEADEATEPSLKNGNQQQQQQQQQRNDQQTPRKLPPSKLIRTSKAAPSGALEPFLVRTQPFASQTQYTQTQALTDDTINDNGETPPSTQIHELDCPMASSSKEPIDMTQPGAFAKALSVVNRCSCSPTLSPVVVVHKPRQMIIRPSKVIPTECTYASIIALRSRVNKVTLPDLAKNLRAAIFCGVVSSHRCLVQCNTELELWNHYELGRELFYQLALAKFGGGCVEAKLGAPIDVRVAMAQALELEERLQSDSIRHEGSSDFVDFAEKKLLTVSDTNSDLAKQAATCLMDHADMLLEYFSIRLERTTNDEKKPSNIISLSGLPVLLDGHSPQPYGLPVFLLRLATEVDWSEEQACFEGICRELGAFYAQVPIDTTECNHHIQHCLFPAISFLLLPPKRFKTDGSIHQLTSLPTLYKAFERC